MNRSRVLLGDLAGAIGFFTCLPIGGGDHRRFARSLWAAPVAGVVVGACVGGALLLLVELGVPPMLAGALAMALSLRLTGALHEDGLADVADAFGGGRTVERKLEIMKDSRLGTYGAAALLVSVLIRFCALAALAQSEAALLGVVVAHTASRAILPLMMHRVEPVRGSGLSAGIGPIPTRTVVVALAIGLAALLLAGPGFALIAVALLALWFTLLERATRRQIGGQTGDVLGTLQQGGEIVLLSLAATLLA